MFLPLVELQNLYGKTINAKSTLTAWEWLLSDFTADQVCYAMKKHLLTNDDFPKPCHIVEILQPKEKLITEAEYVQACKWQERNGFPVFSDALDIIEAYRKQNNETRKQQRIENEKVQAMVSNSVKRISQYD